MSVDASPKTRERNKLLVDVDLFAAGGAVQVSPTEQPDGVIEAPAVDGPASVEVTAHDQRTAHEENATAAGSEAQDQGPAESSDEETESTPPAATTRGKGKTATTTISVPGDPGAIAPLRHWKTGFSETFAVRMVPALKDEFDDFVYKNRTLSKQVAVAAALAHFMDMPADERERVIEATYSSIPRR